MLILFFSYSFLGWLAETGFASIHKRSFQNRGFASTPFCFIYGLTAVVLTVFFQELKYNPVFLFTSSLVVATAIEWFTGKLLERLSLVRWWDYSGKKFNINGYVCLQYAVLWGIAGTLAVRFGNDQLLKLYHFLPDWVRSVVIIALLIVGSIDMIGSFMIVKRWENTIPTLFRWNRKLNAWTEKFSAGVARHVNQRIEAVYPNTRKAEKKIAYSEDHCGFVQIFWFMVIGAFLGDIAETIFCRFRAGVWMSRSSFVWGPFSIVWGMAIAFATLLLHRERNRSSAYIFAWGTFLGGAYEYVCSVLTELAFGKVFWDYSAIPFNLGGRINLLYCFFWGFAAVVWIKILYPKMNHFVAWLVNKTGRWLTVGMLIFMIANALVSVAALIRYEERGKGFASDNYIEEILDTYYGDEKMQQIYPNAIQR